LKVPADRLNVIPIVPLINPPFMLPAPIAPGVPPLDDDDVVVLAGADLIVVEYVWTGAGICMIWGCVMYIGGADAGLLLDPRLLLLLLLLLNTKGITYAGAGAGAACLGVTLMYGVMALDP
jgi:hypothetical protein